MGLMGFCIISSLCVIMRHPVRRYAPLCAVTLNASLIAVKIVLKTFPQFSAPRIVLLNVAPMRNW